MNEPTRLFDCLELQASAPVHDLLAAKEQGHWRRYSTSEVHGLVHSLTAGLMSIGATMGDGSLESRTRIGLISASRPEWIVTDLAVQQSGAVLVPVYPNTNPQELTDIFNEAGVSILLTDNKDHYSYVRSLQAGIPTLKAIYTFDKVQGVPCWADLLLPLTDEKRAAIRRQAEQVRGEDVTTIIYTSGTTGRPKGVMLTHHNILSNVQAAAGVIGGIPFREKRALSFLPLNHIFEKMLAYVYLFYGFSIYYAESMDTIGLNLKEVQPSLFVSVPRLLEKVYERIMGEGIKLKGLKKAIFYWALGLAGKYDLQRRGSLWYRWQMAIADRLVFSKWRAGIGGKIQAIVVGGAANQLRLTRMFTAAGITILEGYGLTETSPVIAVNEYPVEGRRLGTVGPVLPGVQVKIAEDGEILVKGPNVMAGYYKQPELTAEAVTDGWFHTGDIGELQEGRFLKITDRKKEIFKTSGGKYVAPLPIENKIKEKTLIEQIMVIGPGRKFVSALIVPAFLNLKAWCVAHDVPFESQEQVVREPRVLALYQSIIDSFNPQFNHVEQVKKFILLTREWSVTGGELTPKLSLRRKAIMEKYSAEIEQMYAEAGPHE